MRGEELIQHVTYADAVARRGRLRRADEDIKTSRRGSNEPLHAILATVLAERHAKSTTPDVRSKVRKLLRAPLSSSLKVGKSYGYCVGACDRGVHCDCGRPARRRRQRTAAPWVWFRRITLA
ncbi:hypothetical protein EVAR_59137_1 [Eumeta japonica]|uniref:Uncharacterized protein n=1 Tax=Eumeta variegata TaxID=151549 RepID=A0A4C1ZET7_EUMVA|nr:hypothetical protein EVAR_59137_1 [Eumeta japonica]